MRMRTANKRTKLSRRGDRAAHRASGNAEAAVVVAAGHDLELAAVGEQHAAHDVHLPELHGTLALPAAELLATLAAAAELDEAVTHEAAVDRRA